MLPIATFSAKLRDVQVYFVNKDLFAVSSLQVHVIYREGSVAFRFQDELSVWKWRKKQTTTQPIFWICKVTGTSLQSGRNKPPVPRGSAYWITYQIIFKQSATTFYFWQTFWPSLGTKDGERNQRLEIHARCITRDRNSNREEIFPKQLFFPWKSTLPQITSAQNTSLTHAEEE